MAGRLLYGIQINHGFGCEEELFWDRIPDSFLDEIDTHTLHEYNASHNGGDPCGDTFWIYCAEVPEEHAGIMVQTFIILDPECCIPCFVILISIVTFSAKCHGVLP